MLTIYHRQITNQALEKYFTPQALQVIVASNLGQDALRGQIGHSEYHFDNNCFAESLTYMDDQRQQILAALAQGQSAPAWQAFGRLTHSGQDFYAHSNYVQLWQEQHPGALAQQIEPLEEELLQSPDLISGRLYYPLELLAFIPGLERLVKPFLPRDSHTWMNLDAPRSGPRFEFAFAAAVKRTQHEFEHLRVQLSLQELGVFSGTA